jgi:glycerophosphoryl diester phosphodiesterase
MDAVRAGKAVQAKGLNKRVYFFIADPIKDAKTAKAIKAFDPGLQIAVDLLTWWKIEGLATFVTQALDADALFTSEWFFPQSGFREAHNAGAKAFVYLWGTHDLHKRMERAVDLGANMVSCDRPDFLFPEKDGIKAVSSVDAQ